MFFEYYEAQICISNRTYRSLQLAEINEKNTIVPATSYSAGTTLTSSEDDDSDFREIQFQSESLQQVNNSNISQNNYIRYFGFNVMGDYCITVTFIIANLQIFSDYQMQQMSDNFIDSFGFNDDEFNEPDDGAG